MKEVLKVAAESFDEFVNTPPVFEWALPFVMGALCAGVVFAARFHYYEGELRKKLEEARKDP